MPFQDRDKWRVRIWVNGQKFSKTFPPGTPKKVADEYERKLKLAQIDPDLAEKRRVEPTFAEYAAGFHDCEPGDFTVAEPPLPADRRDAHS